MASANGLETNSIIIIGSSQITRLAPNGLAYLDAAGHPGWIDFEQCAANYPKQIKQSVSTSLRCVGDRNVLGRPPYILFYTEPLLKIEFRFSIFRRWRPMKDYYRVKNALRNAGWVTLDLT